MLRFDPPIAQQDSLTGSKSDTGNVQEHVVRAMSAADLIPRCEGVPDVTTDGAYLSRAFSGLVKGAEELAQEEMEARASRLRAPAEEKRGPHAAKDCVLGCV